MHAAWHGHLAGNRFFWGIGMSKAYNEIRRKHLTRARKADEEFAAEIEHRNSTDYM
jgi:hypothetical protein